MSALSLLLNILWIVFGGAYMAFGWVVAAIVMAITIIGIPWARAAFNIAVYTLLPFGQKAVSRAEYLGVEDTGTGFLGFVCNLIWLMLAGLVAGAGPSAHGHRAVGHDHRHPVRLGASKARGHCALADRKDDRADRRWLNEPSHRIASRLARPHWTRAASDNGRRQGQRISRCMWLGSE